MSDLVSIITPAYNTERYLKDTIESVIKQDYDNWELIIIDDCSKDNSKSIAERYMQVDKRIRLISLEKNSGVAFARNTGIKAARGRYIAFLDSDDLWYPDKLSSQIKYMQDNNYYFTFTGYEWIDKDGTKLNKVIKVPTEVDYRRLLKGNPIGCLTVIIDRNKINKLEMLPIRHEDYAAWLCIVGEGINAYGINRNLAQYRKTNSSLSSNKFKVIRWTWDIYRKNQNLSFLRSVRCLAMYAFNTSLKYMGL